ncbi:RNA-binding protein Musashi homolog Rbp6-like [Topomyia yanbarensis]|uniref:RNA-binding protein Musashi homolog Rbp6-like n=1 Tax=Topomyia yanbarensis TaxID=2498891 RepID=UPI00273C5E75|nr:RNA-binding protein Musashi homolog Rbp6-like [Topomyia yanbarensis]XP_058839492.1 RNA-binding protein Musashi homolog Rbp6-like [Topomyia yanbarensis]
MTRMKVWRHTCDGLMGINGAHPAISANEGTNRAGSVWGGLDITNGQLTPNNNTPLLTQALSVMNNYQAAAAAAAQGYGTPASPHTTNARTAGFTNTNSPGPTIDMYSSSAADSVGYVQATSPQPSGFPAIAVSRAPLNYSPFELLVHTNHQAPPTSNGMMMGDTPYGATRSKSSEANYHPMPAPFFSCHPNLITPAQCHSLEYR